MCECTVVLLCSVAMDQGKLSLLFPSITGIVFAWVTGTRLIKSWALYIVDYIYTFIKQIFPFIGLAATPPYSVEIMGPFITWGAPVKHIGHILNYDVRVISTTGDTRLISKDETSFYHMLAREDIPSNLGGNTSVIVQVSDGHMHI